MNSICEQNKFAPKDFSKDALELLKTLPWTGNIRELRNLVERVLIMSSKDIIDDQDLLKFISTSETAVEDIFDVTNSFQEFKEKAERAFIKKQLEANDWNISKTADLLDIQRSHLYSKMKKYDIEKGKE